MKNSLFPVILFLVLLASTWSPVYGPQYSRSPAAKTQECIDLIQDFLQADRPHLSIPKSSLFSKFPDLTVQLEKLEFIPLELNQFVLDFAKKNKRPPTLREALDYIYLHRRAIIANYDEAIADIEAMNNPGVEIFLNELKASREKLNKFKDLDQYEDELKASYESGKSKLTSIDEPIAVKNDTVETRYLNYLRERSREGNFNGELGELWAFGASKDKAIKKGLKFETRSLSNPIPYQLVIKEAVDKLEAALLKKTDKQLVKLVHSYGDGLLRNARLYLESAGEETFDRTILINKIMAMIRTKEIDLIFQKADGKIVWGEVKAYKKPITLDTLNGEGYKAKPMSDQLLEHKALRDILGFKDSVDLRFISPTSVVTKEAKAYIESLGYEVVSAQ